MSINIGKKTPFLLKLWDLKMVISGGNRKSIICMIRIPVLKENLIIKGNLRRKINENMEIFGKNICLFHCSLYLTYPVKCTLTFFVSVVEHFKLNF